MRVNGKVFHLIRIRTNRNKKLIKLIEHLSLHFFLLELQELWIVKASSQLFTPSPVQQVSASNLLEHMDITRSFRKRGGELYQGCRDTTIYHDWTVIIIIVCELVGKFVQTDLRADFLLVNMLHPSYTISLPVEQPVNERDCQRQFAPVL